MNYIGPKPLPFSFMFLFTTILTCFYSCAIDKLSKMSDNIYLIAISSNIMLINMTFIRHFHLSTSLGFFLKNIYFIFNVFTKCIPKLLFCYSFCLLSCCIHSFLLSIMCMNSFCMQPLFEHLHLFFHFSSALYKLHLFLSIHYLVKKG